MLYAQENIQDKIICLYFRSLIGAGLSQFKSESLKINLPFFERFRNSEDRYVDIFVYFIEIVTYNLMSFTCFPFTVNRSDLRTAIRNILRCRFENYRQI